MSLDGKLAATLSDMETVFRKTSALTSQDIISLIDLTILNLEATPDEIIQLANAADQHKVAAICIFPEHLKYVSDKNPIKRATVANFPTGSEPHEQVLQAINQIATHSKVDEIDYVFPYQTYLSGNQKTALNFCHEAFFLCKEHHLLFKVILETGALPSREIIYEISAAILQNGCDFLKTSTGKTSIGATIPAVFAILSAIVDSNVACGVKVSGGIKTKEQAITYIQLAQYMMKKKLNKNCFRLGASGLLGELLQ